MKPSMVLVYWFVSVVFRAGGGAPTLLYTLVFYFELADETPILSFSDVFEERHFRCLLFRQPDSFVAAIALHDPEIFRMF